MEDAGPKEENFFKKLKSFFQGADRKKEDEIEQEIISMLSEEEHGNLQESEAQMITNIFEFSDKEAKDIMTRRSSIIAIEGSTTLKEAVTLMLHEKCSRYPVYIDDIDHIIGILHLKDACRMLEDFPDRKEVMIKKCKGLIREAVFIPETRSINNLFRGMQAKKIHMVIVIDEYGQTLGLVAMEDILEEIVGNIFDEYDEEEDNITVRGNDSYETDGLMTLEELEELLHVDVSSLIYETVSGMMIAHLGHIPKDGENVEMDYADYHFKALIVKDKVVRKVLITKLSGDAMREEGHSG
ncbi:MAG: CBS domain-containing protein [Lachnospiraceae bacterium]|jgi:putative hemolysin|nr:CBS domain-containing protein [Lachnospiraceae bacterium]